MNENNIASTAILIALTSPVFLGIVQGFRGKIVVFRDFNDLSLCFALSVVPLVLVYIGAGGTQNGSGGVWLLLAGISALGLLGLIVHRTWQDNRSILGTLLALITKLPLGVLFIVALINMVAPSGKTAASRSSTRQLAFMGLLLLMPLVMGLTRDRKGLTRFRVPYLS